MVRHKSRVTLSFSFQSSSGRLCICVMKCCRRQLASGGVCHGGTEVNESIPYDLILVSECIDEDADLKLSPCRCARNARSCTLRVEYGTFKKRIELSYEILIACGLSEWQNFVDLIFKLFSSNDWFFQSGVLSVVERYAHISVNDLLKGCTEIKRKVLSLVRSSRIRSRLWVVDRNSQWSWNLISP